MVLTVMSLLGVVGIRVGVLVRTGKDVSVGRTLKRDLVERDVYAQLYARATGVTRRESHVGQASEEEQDSHANSDLSRYGFTPATVLDDGKLGAAFRQAGSLDAEAHCFELRKTAKYRTTRSKSSRSSPTLCDPTCGRS